MENILKGDNRDKGQSSPYCEGIQKSTPKVDDGKNKIKTNKKPK